LAGCESREVDRCFSEPLESAENLSRYRALSTFESELLSTLCTTTGLIVKATAGRRRQSSLLTAAGLAIRLQHLMRRVESKSKEVCETLLSTISLSSFDDCFLTTLSLYHTKGSLTRLFRTFGRKFSFPYLPPYKHIKPRKLQRTSFRSISIDSSDCPAKPSLLHLSSEFLISTISTTSQYDTTTRLNG